jgi:protein-S-isoprenylcysteine O-methyltransferase Ste14
MSRILATLYGLVVYAFFLGTFLYAIGFVENVLVPRSVDGPDAGPASVGALLVNGGLLGLFAVQHSVMARPAFKRWWTQLVPTFVERSTFVLFASAALASSAGSGDRSRAWSGRSAARAPLASSKACRGSAGGRSS